MNYICIHPENLRELNEMWEEVKGMFRGVANKPRERKKIRYLMPGDILASPYTFVCELCIKHGISLKDATHSIEDSFLPKRRTIKESTSGLICRHCRDSGF